MQLMRDESYIGYFKKKWAILTPNASFFRQEYVVQRVLEGQCPGIVIYSNSDSGLGHITSHLAISLEKPFGCTGMIILEKEFSVIPNMWLSYVSLCKLCRSCGPSSSTNDHGACARWIVQNLKWKSIMEFSKSWPSGNAATVKDLAYGKVQFFGGGSFPELQPEPSHGNPFQASFPKYSTLCFEYIPRNVKRKLDFWFFDRYLEGGRPIQKEAYRMPLSIN